MTNPNAKKEKKVTKAIASTMEELLEEQEAQFTPLKVGEMVEGKVLAVTSNKLLVDIEGRAVGVVEGREFSDAKRTIEDLVPGDKVSTSIMEQENEEGFLVLSLKKADAERGWDALKTVFDKAEIINGRVIEANKGGLLLEAEGVRGFMPVSQLAPAHYPRVQGGDKNEIYSRLVKLVGETLPVKVITFDKEQGKVIFSEKEAASPEDRKKVLEKYSVGQELDGVVTGIVSFGAFVKLNDDIEGLVHISEIAWDRVNNINDYLKVGQKVNVMVIGIESDKISLSIKRLLSDPWVAKAQNIKEGAMLEGVVTRVTPFGAFVELEDGLEGLVHVSEVSNEPVTDPSKVLSLGQRLEFRVVSIDAPSHRIALSLKAKGESSK